MALCTTALGCGTTKAKVEPKQVETTASAERQLKAGDVAPDFESTAHSGEVVTLSSLRGKRVVLYFYPKDGTPGCTVEAERFRDKYSEFVSLNTVILGVSADDEGSHQEFAQEVGVPFLLRTDLKRELSKAYGVGSFLGMPSRTTFLIDGSGKIAKIYKGVKPDTHAEELLSDLRNLGAND